MNFFVRSRGSRVVKVLRSSLRLVWSRCAGGREREIAPSNIGSAGGLPWSAATVEGPVGHACGEPMRIKPHRKPGAQR